MAEKQHSDNANKVLVVIPARYESSRFPGKALADLAGAPLVVRTIQRASGMRMADRLVVATDDQRILAAVQQAGFDCEMTADHPTGTDRIGEVAARHEADIVVNLQGDEPLLDARDADALVRSLVHDPSLDIATCGHSFGGEALWRDPNAVKVITDATGKALYFSRAPIPGIFPGSDHHGWQAALRHVGIYAYRAEALRRFLELPRTTLEVTEGLEQLRALENGLRIGVVEIAREPVGVDTPQDLELVRRLWAKHHTDDQDEGM